MTWAGGEEGGGGGVEEKTPDFRSPKIGISVERTIWIFSAS